MRAANMKKKITRQEWNEIGVYNYAAKWLRPLCSYCLVHLEDGSFKREQYIPMCLYLLIFIPAHVIQALYCMWDGGLKEFELAGRHLGSDNLGRVGDSAWTKAKEIWEKH